MVDATRMIQVRAYRERDRVDGSEHGTARRTNAVHPDRVDEKRLRRCRADTGLLCCSVDHPQSVLRQRNLDGLTTAPLQLVPLHLKLDFD